MLLHMPLPNRPGENRSNTELFSFLLGGFCFFVPFFLFRALYIKRNKLCWLIQSFVAIGASQGLLTRQQKDLRVVFIESRSFNTLSSLLNSVLGKGACMVILDRNFGLLSDLMPRATYSPESDQRGRFRTSRCVPFLWQYRAKSIYIHTPCIDIICKVSRHINKKVY